MWQNGEKSGAWKSKWDRARLSPVATVFIVFVAMFLDGALLTTVVPIIPEVLKEIKIHNQDLFLNNPDQSIWMLSAKTTCQDSGNCNSTNSLVTDTPLELIGHAMIITGELENPALTRTGMNSTLEISMSEDNFIVGVILAGKAITQSVFNCFIGAITARIGYQKPMFIGFLLTIGSTILFAYSDTACMMLVARALQGIGTSFSTVSGLGLIAHRFPDHGSRSNYLALAFTGFGLGVLLGPPFGSVVFEFCGKRVPFYILAGIGAVDGILQICTFQPKDTEVGTMKEGSSLLSLLADPYITLTAFTMASANICIAFLETGLPIWMMDAGSREWMLGMPLLAMNVTFILTNNLAPLLARHIGNWGVIALGLGFCVVAMIALPFCRGTYLDGMFKLFGPSFVLGIGCALVDVGVLSTMGTLVDTRHTPVYGTVFAISDIALCVSFAAGPLGGGAIVEAISFEWLLWICAVANFILIPFCYFLKDPPIKNRGSFGESDVQAILQSQSIGADCPSGRYGRFRTLSKISVSSNESEKK